MTNHNAVQKSPGRILGLDIARAFAIIGMVLVNYKVTMGAETSGSGWLHFMAATFDGRAAATFVVLAGIGASLGSRRARQGTDPEARRQAKVTLARRALFLFVIGWAFYLVWPADILHFYGLYLAAGALALFVPSRRLLQLAAASVGISFAFVLAFDYTANWDLVDLSYDGLTTPVGFMRNLFFDGFHPVFPWVSFYFFGMWLGRTDLRDAAWRRLLAVRAAIAMGVAEVLAWVIVGPKGSDMAHLSDESWRWLFSVEPLPPFPLYLVAGAGAAVMVIVGSTWIGERLPERVTWPIVATGQLALTLYLAHVIIGMGVLEEMGRLYDQSLEWAVVTSLVVSVVAIVFSWAWRSRFDRGPLEWVMRRIAG